MYNNGYCTSHPMYMCVRESPMYVHMCVRIIHVHVCACVIPCTCVCVSHPMYRCVRESPMYVHMCVRISHVHVCAIITPMYMCVHESHHTCMYASLSFIGNDHTVSISAVIAQPIE